MAIRVYYQSYIQESMETCFNTTFYELSYILAIHYLTNS